MTDMPERVYLQRARPGFTRWFADTYKPEGLYRLYVRDDIHEAIQQRNRELAAAVVDLARNAEVSLELARLKSGKPGLYDGTLIEHAATIAYAKQVLEENDDRQD